MTRKLFIGLVLLGATIGFTFQDATRARLVTVKGSQDPDGIPNFYAWSHFFDTIASSYQVGGLRWYVGKQMRLEELLEGDSEDMDRLCETLVDAATVAMREQGRLRRERGEVHERLQAGLISLPESQSEFLQCIRQEVAQLRQDRRALHQAVVSLEGGLGAQLWFEIEEYVQGPLKAGTVLQFGSSPFTLEQRAILRSFDDGN